jgi:hypothetical protein
MKSSSQGFVVASAVAGCAVALGFWLGLGGGADRHLGEHDGTKNAPRSAAREGRASAGPTTGSGRLALSPSARTSAESSARRRNVADAPLRVTGRPPQAGGASLNEAEWFARAGRVEREANNELRRLTEMLDLNAGQPADIFGVLARNSPSWLPGMQAGGMGTDTGSKPGPAAESGLSEADQVMAYLNADQQQTLIEEEMDRQAWWEEVLPQLLPPDLPSNTDPAAPSDLEDPVPDTKAFDGADTLIE